MKKAPQRTCIACRDKKDKNDLLRIVRDKKSQTVFFDRSGKANGRGCYVCSSRECIKKITDAKLIKHHLNVNANPDDLIRIQEQMTEYMKKEV